MNRKNVMLAGICILMLTSCMTHVARINDTADVYNMQKMTGAPKIIIADLVDKRADKSKVGRIGALDLNTETHINTLVTNRIALRLREAGFNVQKVHLENRSNKEDIGQVLDYNSGDIYLTGGLENFYIASFDAMLEEATGKVSFYIIMMDKNGNVIIDNTYLAQAKRLIGLAAQSGSTKIIEETIQAGVDRLFNDENFVQSLLISKSD